MRGRMLAAAAALSMLMTSAVAAAQPAPAPGVAQSVRVGEDTQRANELGTDFAVIFVFVAMSLVMLFVVAGGGDSDSP